MKKILLIVLCLGFVMTEDNIDKLLVDAQYSYRNSEHDNAINYSNQIIDIDSTISVAYFIRAESYGFLSKFDLAFNDYSKVIDMNQIDALYLLSHYQRAHANNILGNKGSDMCADFKVVQDLLMLDEFKDFNYLLDKSERYNLICDLIEADDIGIDDLLNLGASLASAGHLIESLSIFSEVIFRDPLKDKAYNNIANCYYDLGEQDKAVQYLHQAISINPNNEQSLQTLGDYYYNRNEMDIALKYLRKSAQLGNVVVQEWLDSEDIDW